ncbi:agglutinin-like protein 2 [Bulinus truncatus]|nr:agglutinin-like protein 2 [Bulinus truncatus]
MKWQDGSVFEGDFKKGLLHGSGVFTLVKSSGQEVQKGQWKDGKLNGKGSICYANGDLYEGYFQDGHRFGHGMLQTGRQRSNCSSVYIGEWLNNMKEGYGVQDDILKGEKYMGMWVEGYRHGSGVLVTLDGMYFEGTFVQNKLTGFGVMISDDNTLYEGDFVGTTYLSGKGVLTLPTGDKLEGNFSGSLNEGLKIHGTFVKSSVSSDGDRKSQHAGGIKSKYFGRLCVSADNKWEDIFTHTWSVLGQNVITSSQFQANTDKAWELVAVMVTSGRKTLKAMSGISPTKLKVQQNTLEELAKIPAHGSEKLTVEVVHEISAYLTKAFDTVYHPLGQLMETLVDVFRASYIGIGAHPRLLHHAIQEVMSYIRRLYKVVRVLFPALPANGGPVHVYPQSQMKDIPRTTEEAQEFIEGLEVEDPNIFVLTAAGLLYPILLPKIYPPLFDLYALYNEVNDDRYWERVTKLNRQSDMGLMAYLGIEQRFWLMDDILQQGKTQKLSTIKDVCYAEAVDALQQLSTAFSPLEKLKIIEQSFNEITKTVTQSLKDDHMWCMDDLFPIFQFVVVRAKIHHLGAEIQIIEDLMEPHLEHGEFGLMFTTLKACYFQVQNEKLPHH